MSIFDRKPFKWLMDPSILVVTGVISIAITFGLFAYLGFGDKTFFTFGVPLYFLGTKVANYGLYVLLLCAFFVNWFVYASIYEVLQQWLYLEVQNKEASLRYGFFKTILTANLYNIYLILNSFTVVQAANTQIPFLLVIICAQIISTTYTNLKFIRDKKSILPSVDPG